MHIRETEVSGRRRVIHSAIWRAQVARGGLGISVRTDEEHITLCRAIWYVHFHHQLQRRAWRRSCYWNSEDAIDLVRNGDRHAGNQVRLPVAAGEWRAMVGIQINRRRLVPTSTRGLLNRELD